MNKAINRLLRNRVSFLTDAGPGEDIAISSRIRLARNLAGHVFPVAAEQADLEKIGAQVAGAVRDSGALGEDALTLPVNLLGEDDCEILFERRLVSRDLLSRGLGAVLCCSADESAAVMVNEEDHLRIQSMQPGFQLREAWEKIDALDSRLMEKLDFAFDEKYGFLTSCPTNVGTGMRASVMLHLPGLVMSNQIQAAIQAVSKLHLAVRGIFGEGTDNRGNLFQISNQSTLGESEQQILARLESVIRQMIAHEKNARRLMLEKEQFSLLDHVGRSYGLLRHAYRLPVDEALNLLSGLRLGVDLGMFSSVDIATVNELFLSINPAHLRKLTTGEDNLDVARAKLVRERLKK